MEKECNSEEHQVTLKVAKSSIGSVDSGVARMNSSHLSCFGDEPPEMVTVSFGKKKKVLHLVADRLAKKDRLIMREGDMEDLKVDEDDEVIIEPYTTLSEDMSASWKKFKNRFKKNDDDEEDEN